MKVVIIGGGASGMALAVMLKQKNKSVDVTVLEKEQRILKKLLVTGNGQCNISNVNHSATVYHGDSSLAETIIGDFDLCKQQEFFSQVGVRTVVQESGKVYPASYQAASVVDALRFSAEEKGVEVICDCLVTSVLPKKDGFEIVADKKYFADKVVIATGGAAGGKLGNTGGYSLLEKLGHKLVDIKPSIVQIKTEKEVIRSLKGIKVDAIAKAVKNGKVLRSEKGEVLFTEYGLSGPAIMQLSGTVISKGCNISLELEEMQKEELIKELKQRRNSIKDRVSGEFLNGFINKRLGQTLLKLASVTGDKKCSEITDNEIEKIASLLKNLDFKVMGDMGFANAQVTSGGVSTEQFYPSLQSKLVGGLYAMGEVLDVDGDCGGFNLAFAWSSANAVAKDICENAHNS